MDRLTNGHADRNRKGCENDNTVLDDTGSFMKISFKSILELSQGHIFADGQADEQTNKQK